MEQEPRGISRRAFFGWTAAAAVGGALAAREWLYATQPLDPHNPQESELIDINARRNQLATEIGESRDPQRNAVLREELNTVERDRMEAIDQLTDNNYWESTFSRFSLWLAPIIAALAILKSAENSPALKNRNSKQQSSA